MSLCNSNVTSGFIDLATFDELEKYLYGGPDATAYFVRETRKATWFTQVPVILSRATGNAAFGQEWSVNISRAGDYLLATWLRVTFPAINHVAGAAGVSLRWTRNLMHNLVEECCLTFNDLVAARFDNYHLDFWAAFTTPAGKRNGYLNMIGDVDDVQGAHHAPTGIPAVTLNLPLPFCYSRDSGVALPTAALPYNEMRINFTFRDWTQLLLLDTPAAVGVPTRCAVAADLENGAAPVLGNSQVWANYAIVSNDERKRMACAPRDILIEQVQTAPRQNYAPAVNQQPSYDIRFSHAIKVLFFSVRNTTVACQWSNYLVGSPVPAVAPGPVNFNPAAGVDPILETTLTYENTQRLAQMGSDYFSLINPWYHAPVIALETGYHTYSYSLDFICLDPKGSTNYGKLTNVSIVPAASNGAVAAAGGSWPNPGDPADAAAGVPIAQTYQFIITAVNNNIIRISGGKLPSVLPTVDCQPRCDMPWVGKQCNISPRPVSCC
jgi:hypothetical protein